jgi:hypothetical protein
VVAYSAEALQARLRTREEHVNNENLEKGAPHRFKPGQSGNPGGRPRKRPISERYEELAELALPEKDRIKQGLPERATYGDALAMIMFKAALEGKTDAAREIREAIEGKTRQRQEAEASDVLENLAERMEAARTRVAVMNNRWFERGPEPIRCLEPAIGTCSVGLQRETRYLVRVSSISRAPRPWSRAGSEALWLRSCTIRRVTASSQAATES